MCGIAGIMMASGAPPEVATLRLMADALAHRGPDSRGYYSVDNVAMLQNRLAIIDLATGDHPLYEPGGAALVGNGEIYNYLELRQNDPLSGINFATASDFEPVLHLFRRVGLRFVEHLRGMYAFALHDAPAGQLVLARDPFGIKPLYYVERPDMFAFASEPKALLAAGLAQPVLETARSSELLELQFTTGRDTPFQGIRRLLPGEVLVLAGGRIVERRRRSPLPPGPPANWSEAEALERLDEALTESVKLHQRSDVPYGMFLSGGIDSSVILALMAKLNDRPVRAFTIGFSGAHVADERRLAGQLAERVGAEHVALEFSESDFWRLLPLVADALDDPTADYAALPTYKLAAEAGSSLKVILTGEGGDELFAGYGRYRSIVRPWWQWGRTMRSRGILDGLGVLTANLAGWRDGITASEIACAGSGRTKLQVAQAVDMSDWLPNDLLNKVDRCLMAHSVEGRVPFLDSEVAAVAFRLPDELKLREGRGKWLLRRWLARHLPEAEPFSRKRGFTVPVAEWISRAGERIGPLVARQQGIRELCSPRGVERLFARTGKRSGMAEWALLFYACWHQRHIRGIDGARDAFELLKAA
ncbi:MAG TPA: asparagine synthase (glutamine-hydrolyzing) [Alphaproteobacteria bacterium]|nr:asparagine synthase (glutamine-hydrolyzing) [Alphaproteobacteria bacterium]